MSRAIYICRIFTNDFKEKFDKIVEKEIDEIIDKKILEGTLTEDRRPFVRGYRRLQIESSYYSMWNNKEADGYHKKYTFENQDDKIVEQTLAEYYAELGIWEPEFEEKEFPSKEIGLQSQPRIEWNGEIVKIDDVKQIYSFTRKK